MDRWLLYIFRIGQMTKSLYIRHIARKTCTYGHVGNIFYLSSHQCVCVCVVDFTQQIQMPAVLQSMTYILHLCYWLVSTYRPPTYSVSVHDELLHSSGNCTSHQPFGHLYQCVRIFTIRPCSGVTPRSHALSRDFIMIAKWRGLW